MRTSRNTAAVIAALVAVYIFWGSTAPAIKVAVKTIPPWYLAALRFLIAGSLLWGWCRLRGVPLPSRRDWRGAALTGTLLLTLGNGIFSWCLQYSPAGVGSLVFALNPLWNALIGAAFYRERLGMLTIAGIVAGLGGMAYLVSPGGVEHLPLWPAVLALSSSLVWSAGTMIQRRYPATDFLQMSAMQMFVGFAELAVLGSLSGEHLRPSEFSTASVVALGYLVVFGSIVGFSAFIWLARNVATVLASTYSYVNPIVAIGLSIVLLGETLTWHTVLGASIVIAGVALMFVPQGRNRQSPAAPARIRPQTS